MSTCPRCAAQFICAMADQTGQQCWCCTLPIEAELPIYPELSSIQDPSCFCPGCLEEWRQIKTRQEEKSSGSKTN